MSTAPPWRRAFGGWRGRAVRGVTISDPPQSIRPLPDSFRESPRRSPPLLSGYIRYFAPIKPRTPALV